MSLYQEFLTQACAEAKNSPDPSTQNGAVLVQWQTHNSDEPFKVIGRASNTFPEGVKSPPERLVRPLKYSYIEHAERGAIYDAAKKGHSTKGSTMFVLWAACADCGRAIIRAGVEKVVVHQGYMDKTPPHWKESIEAAFIMLEEAGIVVDYFPGTIGTHELLFNGELWMP